MQYLWDAGHDGRDGNISMTGARSMNEEVSDERESRPVESSVVVKTGLSGWRCMRTRKSECSAFAPFSRKGEWEEAGVQRRDFTQNRCRRRAKRMSYENVPVDVVPQFKHECKCSVHEPG
jgi:hypothetical protein